MDRYSTQIYWRNLMGTLWDRMFIHNSGKTELATGDRKLILDRQKPAWLLIYSGPTYHLFRLSLPLPPKFEEVEIFGIPGNLHLFGTTGAAKFNLLGTDEQGRDQFSNYCMEVALV